MLLSGVEAIEIEDGEVTITYWDPTRGERKERMPYKSLAITEHGGIRVRQPNGHLVTIPRRTYSNGLDISGKQL